MPVVNSVLHPSFRFFIIKEGSVIYIWSISVSNIILISFRTTLGAVQKRAGNILPVIKRDSIFV